MATISDLRVRGVQLVKTERTHMIYGQSTRSWQGQELQGDAWVPRPITTPRNQRTRPRQGGAWQASTVDHQGWLARERWLTTAPHSI
ncbi:MAG: hypothetical protein GY696_05140 [Gammaproteobacteria bacterium]|nr:hypothetical protein [Gammaproteobacteria bacterium]